MSISQNPLTGQMSGSMANFVTTKYSGQNVIRSKAFKPRNANTVAQQNHRACFKLVVDVYQSFGGLLDQGLSNRLEKQSPYNVFMACNLPNAIDTTGEVPVVDFSKLVVSQGTLMSVLPIDATIDATGITVNFDCNAEYGNAVATDLVVAFARTKRGLLRIVRQARGSELEALLLIPILKLLLHSTVGKKRVVVAMHYFQIWKRTKS